MLASANCVLSAVSRAEAMAAALGSQHQLQFVVRWVTQRPLVLMSLQIKTAPDNLFREILATPLTDNDGTIVVENGHVHGR